MQIRPGDTLQLGRFPIGSRVVEVAQDPYRHYFNITISDEDQDQNGPSEMLSVLWNGKDSWIECHAAAEPPATPKAIRRVETKELPPVLEFRKRRINLVDIATA